MYSVLLRDISLVDMLNKDVRTCYVILKFVFMQKNFNHYTTVHHNRMELIVERAETVL